MINQEIYAKIQQINLKLPAIMSCEQDNQVSQNKVSRRQFCLGTIAFLLTGGISANEFLKGTTGISPLDMVCSWLKRDNPYLPLHPALMEEYFQSAERVIGFLKLKEIIMEKTGNSRPSSVRELLEIGLESAREQGFEGIDGLNMALLTTAGISQTGLEFVVNHYPLFLPEKRSLAIGWDKSRHLLSAAYWTFTILWLNHSGELRNRRKADEFPTGLNLVFELIGREKINEIKQTLTQPHSKRNFPFSPSIKGLTPEEKRVADFITDGGIAFEILTTIKEPNDYYRDPNLLKRQALRMIFQREEANQLIEDSLANPDDRFYCGLRDPGVNRDLFANQAGIALGIALFRLAKNSIFERIPEIPGDDYTEKYGSCEVRIDRQGKVIGDFPPEYERIAEGYEIEITDNGVIKFN